MKAKKLLEMLVQVPPSVSDEKKRKKKGVAQVLMGGVDFYMP